MLLTDFDSFVTHTKIDVREIKVTTLGDDVTVLIRPFSAEEAIRFIETLSKPEGKNNAHLTAVKMSVVNQEGELIFNNSDKSAILKKIPFKAIREIATEALRLNGLGADNEGAAIEATKNV